MGPDDSMYVEGFASNVFGKADKIDRAGRADLYVEFYSFIWLIGNVKSKFHITVRSVSSLLE